MPPVEKPPHERSPTFMRHWRDYRGLSQEDAADRVDVDRTTLGRIENGVLPYNQDFLEKLALAYGCEVEDLLTLDPTKPDPPHMIYSALRRAPLALQKQAWNVIEALLKAS